MHYHLALVFFPVLVLAHFSFLEPIPNPNISNGIGLPSLFPSTCGYGVDLPPLTGGIFGNATHPGLFLTLIGLQTHGKASWQFTFIRDIPNDPNASLPDTYDPPKIELIGGRTVETEGEGSFCLSGPNINETVSDAWLAENGKGTYKVPGWINAKAEMEDGVFYGCAPVIMSYEIPLIFPMSCRNDTTVAVKYKGDDGGDDDTTTTTTATSASTVTATTTATSTTSEPEPSTSADPGETTSKDPHPSYTQSRNATTTATGTGSGPAAPSYTHSRNVTATGSATAGPADPPQSYPPADPTSGSGRKTGPAPTGPAPTFTGAAAVINVGLATALGAGMIMIGLAQML